MVLMTAQYAKKITRVTKPTANAVNSLFNIQPVLIRACNAVKRPHVVIAAQLLTSLLVSGNFSLSSLVRVWRSPHVLLYHVLT